MRRVQKSIDRELDELGQLWEEFPEDSVTAPQRLAPDGWSHRYMIELQREVLRNDLNPRQIRAKFPPSWKNLPYQPAPLFYMLAAHDWLHRRKRVTSLALGWRELLNNYDQ